MTGAIRSAVAAGAGAIVMFIFDPDKGRRRRALVRDQCVRIGHTLIGVAAKGQRDASNRVQGLGASARRIVLREQVTDDLLVARVRSKLGLLVSHPGAPDVEAKGGQVTLRGPVLASERDRLFSSIASVRGVAGVVDELELHETSDDVPGLQGGIEPPHVGIPLVAGAWPPAARVVGVVAGSSLAAFGALRGGTAGRALGVVGAGLVLRSVSNVGVERLTGFGAGRHVIDVQRTVNIQSPLEAVFALWSHYAKFPAFMDAVRQVEDLGEGRSMWCVDGPLGIPVRWTAQVTDLTANERIAWETEDGSRVGHSGSVRFDRNPDGSTRVDVKMSCHPPAGILGDRLARLFNRDADSLIAAQLERFKTLLEYGRIVKHGQELTLAEIAKDFDPAAHGILVGQTGPH